MGGGSGAKRRDWCGRRTWECRDERLGVKGGPHTSVFMRAVLSHSEGASLPLCTHMVGVGSCGGDEVGPGRALHSYEVTRGPARGAATLALCKCEPL